MLDGTSRPTNPEYEPDGIHQEGRAASPAATTPIPLPRASLSFLVKQPGGLGYKLHSKCSKCSKCNLPAAGSRPHIQADRRRQAGRPKAGRNLPRGDRPTRATLAEGRRKVVALE